MLKGFYVVSCLLSLFTGIWMLFFPLSWYSNFPAAIPHTGAFNSHFVRDLGVVYLTIALSFAWCASQLNLSRPVHLGLTFFFTGHALIHLFDILSGRLPQSHWATDLPLVFLPAVVMIALSIRSVRSKLGD
jgi:hypothetical protein